MFYWFKLMFVYWSKELYNVVNGNLSEKNKILACIHLLKQNNFILIFKWDTVVVVFPNNSNVFDPGKFVCS